MVVGSGKRGIGLLSVLYVHAFLLRKIFTQLHNHTHIHTYIHTRVGTMRQAPASFPFCWMWQRRMYRSSLGGCHFEEQLPSSLGVSRAKGGISTAHIQLTKNRKRKVRKRLHIPLTAEGLKAQLQQLARDTEMYTQLRQDKGEVRILDASPYLEENHRVVQHLEAEVTENSRGIAMKRSPAISEGTVVEVGRAEEKEEDMGPCSAVLPGSTVLGSDLDLLERDMMRDYDRRGKELPHFEIPYETLGGRKRGTVTSFHLAAEEYRLRMAKGGRNVILTPRAAETATRGGVNFYHNFWPQENEESIAALPPEANPHFPLEANDTSISRDDNALRLKDQGHPNAIATSVIATTTNDLCTAVPAPAAPYGVCGQRPGDDSLPALRGVEFWDNFDNRHRLQQLIDHATEGERYEMMMEGAMDTSEVGYSTGRVRKETLLYFQAHPINEMIQESFVRVRSIISGDGNAEATFAPGDPDTDVDIPASQARRMARELGLDLIRVGAIYTDKSDRRVVALCTIADHREHMRDMIRFKLQKLGVQPPPTKACIEVPFRGGTHPHAIRFKSVGIAKHLLQGHAVRINLTKFGTLREGFPVFRDILDEVARQALQLRAYHTAGSVRANYNEIYSYLYPSTGRSPKTTVLHPAKEQLDTARDRCILEQEREVCFDDLHNKTTAREWMAYVQKLEKGTAWADKDEGLSLQRQRDMKVMLGYLPKGNHELYAARGDVDIPAPFRASHPTSVERWTHPPESNLEQASRAAVVLGKRLSMTVSEMHDRNEAADVPMTLDRFYYRLEGPALDAGEMKEALGLKRNRKTLPRKAPGWATLGMAKSPSEEPGYATK